MMSEKIKLVLVKRNMNQSQLAEILQTSKSNMYNKMKRDNFSEKEMLQIADALGCKLEINLILNDKPEEKF